ncbi:MAG: permease-like cell division protein FtsX [Spirosomataceae bacterium]
MPKTQRKTGHYPNATVTISLTVALFLIGLCGLLTIQAKKLSTLVRENIEVQVHLDADLSTGGQDTLLRMMSAKPYVAKSEDGKAQITFISKDEAAKKLMEDTKENFQELLGENPLRNSYAVKVQEAYFEEARLKVIKTDLEKLNGVYEVTYAENLVDEVNQNISKIYLILSGFVGILLVIIVMLVNNTIKLALFSQRLLIRSMQLVGATSGFIQKPFIIRGALQGLISGLISSGLLILLQQAVVRQIEGFSLLQDNLKMVFLLVGVVILGVLIGVLSTFQSVHKYLRMSLDELY